MTSTENPRAGTSLPVRVIGWAVCFGLGLAFGALGTVMHQANLNVGFPLPYGYVLAAAALIFLLFGLRLATGNRIAAGVAALGAITSTGLFGLQSPGGSILIPANVFGYLWTFTPTVVALVVLAWPLSRTR